MTRRIIDTATAAFCIFDAGAPMHRPARWCIGRPIELDETPTMDAVTCVIYGTAVCGGFEFNV